MSGINKYQVLVAPHVSEKSSLLSEVSGQHTFKVDSRANKLMVKKAVESIFSVQVRSVRILNVKGKKKRTGRLEGVRSDWKKAVVRLEAGQDIDFLSVGGG